MKMKFGWYMLLGFILAIGLALLFNINDETLSGFLGIVTASFIVFCIYNKVENGFWLNMANIKNITMGLLLFLALGTIILLPIGILGDLLYSRYDNISSRFLPYVFFLPILLILILIISIKEKQSLKKTFKEIIGRMK